MRGEIWGEHTGTVVVVDINQNQSINADGDHVGATLQPSRIIRSAHEEKLGNMISYSIYIYIHIYIRVFFNEISDFRALMANITY